MKSTRVLSSSIVTILTLVAARQAHGQAISLGGTGTYLQDFNSLTGVATNWTDNGTFPGWYARTDTTPNPLPLGVFTPGGGVVSGLFDVVNGADHALGWRPTTTNYGMTLMGVVFQNTSGGILSLGQLQYTGELWRTQATANNVDGYQFFYQISATPVTDLGPFTVANGATYAANAAVADPGWNRLTGLDYATSNAAADAVVNPAITQNVTQNLGLVLQPGEYITLRWRNPNDTAGDALMAIDDLSLSYFLTGVGSNLVYNPGHTVGGAPNGVLAISPAQYWLNNGNPSGLAQLDSVTFAADVLATIDVPANIALDAITVSAGNYTIGGVGAIQGRLTKSGTGTLVLTSANAFNSITLNDNGTIVALADNAASANSLTLGNGGTLDITGNNAINGAVTGTGPLTKIGPGQLTLGGGLANTYTGVTNVNAGTLILGKLAGTVAIPGNLNVAPGGIVRYVGNNVGNQIADTAVITLNQANFGDLAAGDPTNPGAPETVASVVMTGGQFSTGRAVFTTTGNFTVNGGGTVISHRAGTLAVGNTLTVDGTVNLHGGSATAAQESRVSTGAGGLVLNNGTFRLNMGTTLNDASMGSIVLLGGNVVSTGTSSFVRANATALVPKADIDLQGVDRTFNVTGSLRIGSTVAPVLIQNGGVVKTGPGVLTLGGNQIYTQPTTINGGKLSVDGSLASSTVTVGSGGVLGGIGSASGAVTVNNTGGIEAGIDGQGILNISSLTLGVTGTDTTSITLTQNVVPATLAVLNPGGLVANGTVLINLLGDTPQLGQHLLIDYEGTIGGTGQFGAFALGTIPNRMTASLFNDTGASQIFLDVVEVDQPVWSGALNSEWSVATLADPKNWVLNTNSLSKTDFLVNDNVLFTNFAFSAPNPNPVPTTNEVVDISGSADVVPSSVRFTHSGGNTYTITGSKAIAGPGSLVLDGSGTVVINNVNSFTGGVSINGGTIEAASIADAGVNSALGAGNSISLNNGALIITASVASTNRALNVGAGGALILSGDLTMSGALSGVGTLAKLGAGKLILTGSSPTYNGTLQVSQGSVQYSGASIGGNNMTVVVDTGATLENNDVVETVFNDATTILRTLSISTGGGTINVLNAAGAILFDRPDGIAGTGSVNDPIRKAGPGIMRAHVDNTSLHSPWILNEGTLEVGTLAALGDGMVTMNGGLLASRNVPVQNPITVNGGTIGTRSGDVADFQGTIFVAGPMGVSLLSYTTPTNSQTITLSGSLEGNGNITVTGLSPQTNGGNKALILTNPINSYSGTILVSPGQFLTSQPATTGSALGTATVSLNDAGLNIRDDGLGNDGFLTYNNPVIVNGVGTSSIDVNRGTNGTFVGNTVRLGTLSIGAQTLNVTGGNTYKASFSGTTTLTAAPTFQPETADLLFEGNITGAFGFTKAGAGRMVVTGATTFTGPVTVQAGTLAVNDPGSTAADSDFTVQGGSLVGTGVIGGDVNVTGGVLAPGDGIGVLSVGGNVAFSPGSVFSVQLSHATVGQPAPGIDYDQLFLGLSAASTVNLNDASLTLNVGAGILEGDLFFILLNDGADAINGTFAGLSDGAIFSSGGQFFQISYDANAPGDFNGGNDIALMAVPEPGSLLLLGGGLFLLSGRRRRA